jgi:hypothetical protein
MHRRLWCGLLYLLLAGAYAHAAEPAVITLSCGGTVKTNIGNNEGQRKLINKVELLVDLAEHKVSFAGYVAHIEDVDGMNVFFGGNEDPATGDINGDSGLMSATAVSGNVHTSYELFCKRVTPSNGQKAK